jgi:predicted dehydrogenase
MRPPRVNVAVVGLGVGEQHARAYLRCPNCKLSYVFDLDRSRSERLAPELGSPRIARSLDEILRDDTIHLLSIASFDDAHFAQVLATLKADKHVFVEKPLCRTLEEARTLKTAWAEAGAPHLASNLVLRSAPLYVWLRNAIQSGELGDIYAFDGDYLYGRIHKITEGWRKNVDNYSVMQGGGVHLVDLMLWLTGQRPAAVATVGNRICTSGTVFRYMDHMAATYVFPSGLIGRITANFGCVHRHQHVLRIFGTKGTFLYDDQGPRLHTSRDPEGAVTPLELAPLPPSKGELIPDFVEALLAGKDTAAYTQHEFDVIAACVAADRALAQGGTVRIEYV